MDCKHRILYWSTLLYENYHLHYRINCIYWFETGRYLRLHCCHIRRGIDKLHLVKKIFLQIKIAMRKPVFLWVFTSKKLLTRKRKKSTLLLNAKNWFLTLDRSFFKISEQNQMGSIQRLLIHILIIFDLDL